MWYFLDWDLRIFGIFGIVGIERGSVLNVVFSGLGFEDFRDFGD
jgi:hypothetical protein